MTTAEQARKDRKLALDKLDAKIITAVYTAIKQGYNLTYPDRWRFSKHQISQVTKDNTDPSGEYYSDVLVYLGARGLLVPRALTILREKYKYQPPAVHSRHVYDAAFNYRARQMEEEKKKSAGSSMSAPALSTSPLNSSLMKSNGQGGSGNGNNNTNSSATNKKPPGPSSAPAASSPVSPAPLTSQLAIANDKGVPSELKSNASPNGQPPPSTLPSVGSSGNIITTGLQPKNIVESTSSRKKKKGKGQTPEPANAAVDPNAATDEEDD